MEFKDSGLPQTKLIEEAFKFSKANALSNEKDAMKDFKQQIDMIFTQREMMLDMQKNDMGMPEADYDREKKKLDKAREEQMRVGPQLIRQELNNMFVNRRVGLAKEVQANTENPSEELVAAVMLIDCVRSPLDYKNISEKFGNSVADLIAEVVHIDAYPSEREENLTKSAPDTKRAYLAMLVASLDGISKQVEKMAKTNPNQKIMFPPGQEETLFRDAQPVWGNDKKLDSRFVAAFNKASAAASSVYRLEVDAKGALELVKDSAPPPSANGMKLLGPGQKGPKPPRPPGSGGIGGDVF